MAGIHIGSVCIEPVAGSAALVIFWTRIVVLIAIRVVEAKRAFLPVFDRHFAYGIIRQTGHQDTQRCNYGKSKK